MWTRIVEGMRPFLEWVASPDSIVPMLTVGSILAIVYQIAEQTKNSRREKAIDIFQDCLDEFEALLKLRLEIMTDPHAPDAPLRTQYYFQRYWDLFVTEYEYAKYKLIPKSLFVHFCIRLWHAFHDHGEEVMVGNVSVYESWDNLGRPAHCRISPRFCSMIDLIRSADSDTKVRGIVLAHLKKNARDDFFGSFK